MCSTIFYQKFNNQLNFKLGSKIKGQILYKCIFWNQRTFCFAWQFWKFALTHSHTLFGLLWKLSPPTHPLCGPTKVALTLFGHSYTSAKISLWFVSYSQWFRNLIKNIKGTILTRLGGYVYVICINLYLLVSKTISMQDDVRVF